MILQTPQVPPQVTTQVRQATAESLALKVESLQEHAGYLELEEKLAVGALRNCRERLLQSESDSVGLTSQLEYF